MGLLHHLLGRRPAFTLLPVKHLGSAPKISVPLQVPTAAPEAALGSSIKASLICVKEKLHSSNPNGKQKRRKRLRSPADFCLAVHLVWQHSGGRGCAATSSLGICASRSRDREPQHIHSLGSINPWPGTSHQKHNSKCHIHAPTEKCQQVTRRDRGRKCSPLIFHLPSA